MPKLEHICPPAALRRPHAAAYVGCSAGYFDGLVSAGIMPRPRTLNGIKVWLRYELDEALMTAPFEGGEHAVTNPCDRLLAP